MLLALGLMCVLQAAVNISLRLAVAPPTCTGSLLPFRYGLIAALVSFYGSKLDLFFFPICIFLIFVFKTHQHVLHVTNMLNNSKQAPGV